MSRGRPDWDKRYERAMVLVPWLLLAPPTVVSQLPPGQSWTDRGITLALVAAAAGWVYLLHSRVPPQRRSRAGMLVYFAGVVGWSVALMSRDPVFVVFGITGFFHAYQLKPWPVGVGGVFATAVANNAMTALPDSVAWFVGLTVIQTAAIGSGVFFAEKATEQQRERDQMVAKLEAALEENAGLHAQLLTQAREAGVLDERQRMAREIHDTLAQGLTGIITQVQAAQRVWHAPDQARPHVDRALGLARDSLAEARRSVQALRPRELDGAQLPDALGDLARRWADGSGVDLRVDVTGDPVPLSTPIEVALFRVAQEALTNVAKHARASRVGLTLSYLGDVVLLDIRDDGVGINNGRHQGFGLKSMTQRIRSVGGTVTIESTPDDGTAVSASVPAITMEAP
jgi:signal transduction histidine kinase